MGGVLDDWASALSNVSEAESEVEHAAPFGENQWEAALAAVEVRENPNDEVDGHADNQMEELPPFPPPPAHEPHVASLNDEDGDGLEFQHPEHDYHQELAVAIVPPGYQLDVFDGEPATLACLPKLIRFSRTIPDDRLNLDSLRASGYFLRDQVAITTNTACAASLGLDRKFVRTHRLLAASASVHMERAGWHKVEEALAKGRPGHTTELLVYLETVSYDGVDFKLRAPPPSQPQAAIADGQVDITALAALGAKSIAPVYSTGNAGALKILQSEAQITVLVRIDGKLFLTQCNPLSWLQCVDRNTGEIRGLAFWILV